eukprot:1128357-Amphidinium_carterae.1
MAFLAPLLSELLAAAFVEVGLPLSEAFVEALGGTDATMEDLAFSTPADIEEDIWSHRGAYPSQWGRVSGP